MGMFASCKRGGGLVFIRRESWKGPRARWLATACAVLILASSVAIGVAQEKAAQPAGASGTNRAGQASQSKIDRYYDPLPQDIGEDGLQLTLRKLKTTGRLMQIDAHPDDEDGGMLTLEARGQGVETLLMTLTRGEGGQNKLGSNLFDVLGVLRTLEVLAADRYYGVEQRFSSVADFGYSKTPEETFQKWHGHDIALGDIVLVIRTFRPDVLIARFSGTERDGHGHHQASAILTKEAFRAAADPNRFPEQIAEGLQPWQPKKLYIGNVCGFGAATCDAEKYTVKLNTGKVDPVLGTSYVQFALKGLQHQESQGLAGVSVPQGDRFTYYKLVDAAPELLMTAAKDKDGHEQDFFDGIDVTLAGAAARLGDEEKRAPWLHGELQSIAAEIKRADDKAESDPASTGEPLSKAAASLEAAMDRLSKSSVSDVAKANVMLLLETKRQQAQRAANIALSLRLEANVVSGTDHGKTAPPFKDALTVVSPGQIFQITAKMHNGSERWLLVDHAELEGGEAWIQQADAGQMTVGPGQDYYANFALKVPADAPVSRPYWHRDNPETDSLNTIDDERYRTLPFAPPPLRVRVHYELIESNRLHSPAPEMLRKHGDKETPPQEIAATVYAPFTQEDGSRYRFPLAVAPVFSLSLEPGEQVLPVSDGRQLTVKVGADSNLSGAPGGTLHLKLPANWRDQPNQLQLSLPKRGDQCDSSFNVQPASLQEEREEIRALLEAGGERYTEGYTLVTREDLGAAYYYQPALQHVSIVDVKVPKDLKLGYIMGAGDDIPTVLEQIGMNVTMIPADKLPTEDLSKYQTIVLGIRAYDTQNDVIANNKRLLDYVSAGGRLVVQYNTMGSFGVPIDFNGGKYTPYPATLSRARVSVEEAPVRILEPSNAIFHYPNEITQKDFEGWVQERGLYFMSQWDSHFTPLLESHDPGEPEQKGGLLIAQYGKGTYIYTGYAFFRQLPAGVPGAVRLFVNLVSAR
jgi:LmbE family N-acetylglucosaminyl deacetylase